MVAEEQDIVIIGGGIIGCTLAYYLTRHASYATANIRVTVLEASRVGVAQGASGKAGGLVAKWAYPSELTNVSFPEHVRLAEEHGGKERWGWRYVKAGNWSGDGELLDDGGKQSNGNGASPVSLEKTNGLEEAEEDEKQTTALPEDLNWVKQDLTMTYTKLAPDGHTAQVHPYQFTTSMLQLAQEKGAKLILGQATAIARENGRVTGVTYTEHATGATKTLRASKVVLAAGAWSASLEPTVGLSATRAHSITIKTDAHMAPYVLFTEIQYPSRAGPTMVSPEIYARADEVYACGPGDHSALPANVDDVEVDAAACESIRAHVASISAELRAGTVLARQACFLPQVLEGSGPIIGEAKKVAKGLYIATGHYCWGISNAPGTAKAMSELIMEGKIKCSKMTTFDPSRFMV